MFTGFFYALREAGVPVSLREWLTFLEALAEGVVAPSLASFHAVARAVLVKDEAHYDRFDAVFTAYFADVATPEQLVEAALRWVQDALRERRLSEAERQALLAGIEPADLERLARLFAERLREQDGQHHGGPYWIGTGGTSPFGRGGVHPNGLRVGGGGGNRTAAKVAGGGRYRDYRTDEVIGVRQFQVALRRLRRLTSRQDEPPDELDVDGTIDATAQNAGRLQLAWRHSRRNDIKLLALFDVGGSMDPYVELCNRLFSALHQSTHLKAFKTYYFHNCVYEHLYLDARLERKRSHRTADVLRHHDRTWRLVLVGDASMAPSELLERDGIIFWGQSNSEPGIVWLERLARHFDRSAWLNPMPIQRWPSLYGTVQRIAEVFPMFELTLDGLDRAIDHLTGRRRVEPLPPSGVYRGR